jgi:hypothetical protein
LNNRSLEGIASLRRGSPPIDLNVPPIIDIHPDHFTISPSPPSTATDGAGVDAAAGDVTHLDVNTTITRPNFSVVGRVFVHGPSGNVAVGDISSYNDTSGAPAQKLEVDGSAMVRGDVVFDNSNGESSIVVLDANADALTVKDAGASPITYWKINSATSRLETHAPLHILDTRIEALDNSTTGLQFTAEAGNPLITLDTSDSAENVKVAYPLNAQDTTDSCDTSVDGTCGAIGVGGGHRRAHGGEENIHDWYVNRRPRELTLQWGFLESVFFCSSPASSSSSSAAREADEGP